MSVAGCRWVYATKVHLDGTLDRLKARLVAKGYTQVYGLAYSETYSPQANIAYVRPFISLATTYLCCYISWMLKMHSLICCARGV